jgi:hypothetical protein
MDDMVINNLFVCRSHQTLHFYPDLPKLMVDWWWCSVAGCGSKKLDVAKLMEIVIMVVVAIVTKGGGDTTIGDYTLNSIL